MFALVGVHLPILLGGQVKSNPEFDSTFPPSRPHLDDLPVRRVERAAVFCCFPAQVIKDQLTNAHTLGEDNHAIANVLDLQPDAMLGAAMNRSGSDVNNHEQPGDARLAVDPAGKAGIGRAILFGLRMNEQLDLFLSVTKSGVTRKENHPFSDLRELRPVLGTAGKPQPETRAFQNRPNPTCFIGQVDDRIRLLKFPNVVFFGVDEQTFGGNRNVPGQAHVHSVCAVRSIATVFAREFGGGGVDVPRLAAQRPHSLRACWHDSPRLFTFTDAQNRPETIRSTARVNSLYATAKRKLVIFKSKSDWHSKRDKLTRNARRVLTENRTSRQRLVADLFAAICDKATE